MLSHRLLFSTLWTMGVSAPPGSSWATDSCCVVCRLKNAERTAVRQRLVLIPVLLPSQAFAEDCSLWASHRQVADPQVPLATCMQTTA